jgi:hypothetical protein
MKKTEGRKSRDSCDTRDTVPLKGFANSFMLVYERREKFSMHYFSVIRVQFVGSAGAGGAAPGGPTERGGGCGQGGTSQTSPCYTTTCKFNIRSMYRYMLPTLPLVISTLGVNPA